MLTTLILTAILVIAAIIVLFAVGLVALPFLLVFGDVFVFVLIICIICRLRRHFKKRS